MSNKWRIVLLIGEVILLLPTAYPLVTQSASDPSSTAGKQKSDTAAPSATPAPADNSCEVLAGVPPASEPKTSSGGTEQDGGGDGPSSSGTSKNSGKTPVALVTVNTTGTAKDSNASQGNQNSKTKDAMVVIERFQLPDGDTDAAQIAPTLQGIFPRIVKAVAVNPSLIVTVLDTNPTSISQTSTAQHSGQNLAASQSQGAAGRANHVNQKSPISPASQVAATPIQTPAPAKKFDVATLKKQIQSYINNIAQPAPRVFAVALPAGRGGGCQVAKALINAIPEIYMITAVDDSRLLVTPARDAGPQSSGLVAIFGKLAAQVHRELELIKVDPKEPQNISHLLVALNSWNPAPNTEQIAEIENLLQSLRAAPANEPLHEKLRLIRILLALDEPLEARIRRITAELSAPDPETDVIRLFYLHDPVAVATLINNAYTNVRAQPLFPDKVVLSEPVDRDERARAAAMKSARNTVAWLDEPHPQVGVDAWSLQLATSNGNDLGNVIPQLEDLVGTYNNAIDLSAQAGWQYLSGQIEDPANLDHLMREYLTYTTRVDQNGNVDRWALPTTPLSFRGQGYGLGYSTLYYPLTPNLIDMLVTLASLNRPRTVALGMLERMEGPVWSNQPPRVHSPDLPCRTRDEQQYQIKHDGKVIPNSPVPRYMQFECVYDALIQGLLAQPTIQPPATSALGQFRAALVDFLFHYKLMHEYPDDFHPYLEPMAADTLDSALQPFVDAFDEDMSVFQAQLQAQISERFKRFPKIQYGYGGLVNLKVLGDDPGSVKTATQNYFDATPAPTLNDLFANLQAEGASLQESPFSSLVTSIAPAKTVELMTVLGQTLSAKATTAHLGRGLDMNVTAHTLSGAFGTELDLSVQSTENGAGLIQAGSTKTTDDLNSRVSQHTVDTKVRVDSIKLFKVSTLSGVLARGQAPWKPIDPLFEVPALGYLVNRPRKPNEVFTQSLVFVDAIVIPTAADLGFGVPYTDDQISESNQLYTKLHQLSDFPDHLGDRIMQYHQKIVDCLNREYIDSNGDVRDANNITRDPCYADVSQDLYYYDAVGHYSNLMQ